jgi:predicted lactoylglutathione lyase
MLVTEPMFNGFSGKQPCDTATHAETMLALSADDRDEVDRLVDTALAAGAQPSGETMDEGPMYSRGFQDLDGHIWSVMYMDMSVVDEGWPRSRQGLASDQRRTTAMSATKRTESSGA